MSQNPDTPDTPESASAEPAVTQMWVTETWDTILENCKSDPNLGLLQLAKRMKATEERYELELRKLRARRSVPRLL